MNGIKYVGPFLDASGFAQAARTYLRCLVEADIPVTTEILRFEENRSNFNLDPGAQLAIENEKRETDYDTVLVHATPENFPKYIDPAKRNIGYTTWESSVMPAQRVQLCNGMSEIWVPSEYNREIFVNSGVTVPVKVLPHAAEPGWFERPDTNLELPIRSDTFKFLSIAQLSSRKNLDGLARAYLTGFTSEDNVCLIVKTYINRGGDVEKKHITDFFGKIKVDLGLTNYPPMLLISEILDERQIRSLYYQSNCYVSAHRSEGFGLPIFEAMAAGLPTIATGFSGNVDFMPRDFTYHVNYQMSPVYGMSFSPHWREIYKGNQDWADPDLTHLRSQMRYVFEHQSEAYLNGIKSTNHVLNNFSTWAIGKRIREFLS